MLMSRRWLSIFTVFAFIFSLPVSASEPYPAYAIPPESSLVIKQVKTVPPFLYFAGEAAIRAKFRFDYIATSEGGYVELMLDVVANGVETLPYLVERGRDEKPVVINVSNAVEAAHLLLNEAMLQPMLSGEYHAISGEASIMITDFGAGYECDQAVFIAKLLSVTKQYQMPSLSHARVQSGC